MKTSIKAHGIHYTPPELARFLAEMTWKQVEAAKGPIRVLDPACGDGGLLFAFAQAASRARRKCLLLAGYERDTEALARAERLLARLDVGGIDLRPADFLALDHARLPGVEVVIANPPYVRTQVLGARRAQELARRFALSGRVDLAHAFIRAMATVLRPRGTLGLLTSNRFLCVQSGAVLRAFLCTDFELGAVYDLGDTRLFGAAVLPAVVVGRKGPADTGGVCSFHRVYEQRATTVLERDGPSCATVLDALRGSHRGRIQVGRQPFLIERGVLARPRQPTDPWLLATREGNSELARLAAHQQGTFADVARVRVGIKTTADRVFVRADWEDLPADRRPEAELLHPLLTHREAARWRPQAGHVGRRRVLYPHQVRAGRCVPIALEGFPRARAYLEAHRPQLEARTYVGAAGRAWYEIWVPQDPAGWAEPKIVFPDIAESPRFFLDRSGALVQGDCYWITLKPGLDPRWLFVMLAVANSSFGTWYYDTLFHNQLYGGRRRFMTQYVKQFPLPRLEVPAAGELVEAVAARMRAAPGSSADRLESAIDDLVWKVFGLSRRAGAAR